MRAIRQHAFGGLEALRLEELPDPHPGESQVRVRVESAGVHLLDTMIRRGEAPPRALPRLPATPGREVAGRVDEVGPGVDPGWLGRRVVADLGPAGGGYATHARVPAAALHQVPEGLDADEAVAMVGTGRTALAILYSRPDWPDRVRAALGGRRLTLALDGVGGRIGRSALELLGPGGRLVMYGMASGRLTELWAQDLFARGITASSAIGPRILERPGGLRPLEARALAAAATGDWKAVIGQRFPLEDAAAAQWAVETRATTGKTVLHP